MKKILTVLTIWFMVGSTALACYAGEHTRRGKTQVESFEIYAAYKERTTEYYTAAVENGTGEIELPDGTVLTVSGIQDDALVLVVYPISKGQQDDWQWFLKCMEGKGSNIVPMEIYFIDQDGVRYAAEDGARYAAEDGAQYAAEDGIRYAADGVTIQIASAKDMKNPAVFSIGTDGKSRGLDYRMRNGSIYFIADGSPYYILAESEEKPTESPTSAPNQPGNQSGSGQNPGNGGGDSQDGSGGGSQGYLDENGKIRASGAKTEDTAQPGTWIAVLVIAGGSIFIISKKKQNS